MDSPFEFDLSGMVPDMASPLAQEGMDLFVVAAQDSDYLVVREQDPKTATGELARYGFSLESWSVQRDFPTPPANSANGRFRGVSVGVLMRPTRRSHTHAPH